MNILSRLKITSKLGLLSIMSVAALLAALTLAASFLHQKMMDERIAKLHAVVEMAYGIATDLEKEVAVGHITHDQAIERMRTSIYSMWYDHHTGYLFVHQMDGVSIANAADPKQQGTNRLALKDVNGTPIVGSMIEALRTADEGVTTYYYPKPGQTEALPKTTFVKKFPAWNALIGTGVYTDDIEAEFRSVLVKLGLVASGILILLIGAVYVVSRDISRPLASLKLKMEKLVAGDLGVVIDETGRRDEIGAMAKTVQVFKDNAVEIKRLQSTQDELKSKADAEKKAALQNFAHQFETAVGTIVNGVSSTATELQSSAQSMSAAAEEANRQATAVAAASEQASANVQTVASAAEELSSSISEISRQVSESTRIAGQAVAEATLTNSKVKALADAAQKIGDVVKLINDIAGQTNLLALNATIEAARAGEAGKGFAVVASEVKSLATQTARATEDIASQVKSIQGATTESVAAIESITGTIGRVNEIATTIAAAVEEQGAATKEIARNVQQASAGTAEVSTNIAGVTQAAGETGQASNQVLSSASELAKQGETLRAEVGQFLANIRSA